MMELPSGSASSSLASPKPIASDSPLRSKFPKDLSHQDSNNTPPSQPFTEEESKMYSWLKQNPTSLQKIVSRLATPSLLADLINQNPIFLSTILSALDSHNSHNNANTTPISPLPRKSLSHIKRREGSVPNSPSNSANSTPKKSPNLSGSRVRQTVERYEQLSTHNLLNSLGTSPPRESIKLSEESTNDSEEDTSWLNRKVVDYDHTGQKQIESTEDLYAFVDLVQGLYDVEPDPTNIATRIIYTAGAVISAERCSLFLFDKKSNQLYTRVGPQTFSSETPPTTEIKMCLGQGVAGIVAQSGEIINIADASDDDRLDLLERTDDLRSLLCMPIRDKDGIIGVAQLINKKGQPSIFDVRDERRFGAFLAVCSLAIRSALAFESLRKAQQKSELLLKLGLKVSKQLASDAVSKEIIAQSRQFLSADRCSLFLVDTEVQPNQLYSEFFDDPTNKTGKKEIRFNLDTGIAGYVATTGQPLNIDDAYEDPRFNRAIDLATGYCTKSLLCMPLSYGKQIVGVAQLVNKLGEVSFTQEDQEFFHAFAVFCGIALHKALLFERLLRSQQKNLVALELLSYHSTCTLEDVQRLLNIEIPTATALLDMNSFMFDPHAFKIASSSPNGHGSDCWSQYSSDGERSPPNAPSLSSSSSTLSTSGHLCPPGLSPPISPHYPDHLRDSLREPVVGSPPIIGDDAVLCVVLRMFIDLGYLEKYNIAYETLCRWVLTVRKNYRRIPYHNFVHAVSVAHTVYLLIKHCGLHRYFEEHELLAMFVGSLCHDLDHRGTNNAFQKLTQTPLSGLYSTSILENHHFNHAIFIIHSEGHNIFQNLPQEKYKSVLTFMEQNIIATDLANHLGSRKGLEALLADFEPIPWPESENQPTTLRFTTEEKRLLSGLLMTCSDLANVTKPTPISKHIAKIVYNEFCQQGDMEKTLGVQPLPIMDRQKEAELPRMQVEFIDYVCLPAFNLLLKFLPETQPFIDGININRAEWLSSSKK
eukprot:TRINITY_DN5364_c0_g1_i1.p1 TRINITY_DN5364_c0_g1~~TRINITY_DN5364_c0_g1_i1.p1  ORF type:complete len:988 (+),score=189.36 TRINITY_DN5364_c0_g1_i1:83-3046(+)